MDKQFRDLRLNEYSDGELPADFLAQFPIATYEEEAIVVEEPVDSLEELLVIAKVGEDEQALSGLLMLIAIVLGAAMLIVLSVNDASDPLSIAAVIGLPIAIIFWGLFIVLFDRNENSRGNRFLRRIYQGTILILGTGLLVLVLRLLYLLFAGL